MSKDLAISLKEVSKVYRLHSSPVDQLIDVLGLGKLGFRPKVKPKEFVALNNISLQILRGHRVGIVGRNGAGKTTLLKLICGNFAKSTGEILINGRVQALMSTGLGFHPEYTGRQNVKATLQYNGLNKSDYEDAINGIIEFCELGDYLDQPFKTYSLGMQARLMFAAATAIKPDILIVDEVLGAGDAYFVAKSKGRVEKLIQSGCTMLLVSHSMQQVLELCDEVIWLEHGVIKMRGEPLVVVKAYEMAMHGRMKIMAHSKVEGSELALDEINQRLSPAGKEALTRKEVSSKERFAIPAGFTLQLPGFLPHENEFSFPKIPKEELLVLRHVAPGGVSRWDSEKAIKVVGFSIQTERGIENHLHSLHPVKFILTLQAELSKQFSCMYGIVFNDSLGNVALRIWSPPDTFMVEVGETKIVEMFLNPLQLGPGEYTIGISVVESTDIELVNNAPRYDLLGRSFICSVELDNSLSAVSANFIHSAEWKT